MSQKRIFYQLIPFLLLFISTILLSARPDDDKICYVLNDFFIESNKDVIVIINDKYSFNTKVNKHYKEIHTPDLSLKIDIKMENGKMIKFSNPQLQIFPKNYPGDTWKTRGQTADTPSKYVNISITPQFRTIENTPKRLKRLDAMLNSECKNKEWFIDFKIKIDVTDQTVQDE